jgi:hypothetical protein
MLLPSNPLMEPCMTHPVFFRLLLCVSTGLAALAWAPARAAELATETRPLAGFDSVAARGSIDIVLRQGAREAVTVQAERDLLPLIETVVEPGRVLRIGLKKGESMHTRQPVVVTVDVVELKSLSGSGSGDILVETLKTPALSLSLSGSGDAQLRQLQAGEFRVNIAGSGDVAAAGSVGRFEASIAGSGDVRAQDLSADDVRVNIAGSGDARVTAHKALSVSIVGSGDVQYSGEAAVRSSVVGSGTVTRR